MKIKSIDVYQVDLPYSGGTYHLSGDRTYKSFDATIVRILSQCGLEGWGESTPFGATYVAAHAKGVRAGIAEIAPFLIGLDPRLVDKNYDAMQIALKGHRHAKAPLDIACWDLWGKSVERPVYDLLGGKRVDRLPLISSIHSESPEKMRTSVAGFRAKGYRGHSIKIGATEDEGGPFLDAERIVASLADSVAGEFFIVDANGGLSIEQALRLLELLPSGLNFVLEAPCATWQECLSLRARTSRPIFYDELAISEADISRIIELQAADGIGLKLSKCGGITPARRQRDICIAGGLAMSVQDTVGSEIAFAAVAHTAHTVPSKFLRCVLDTREMVSLSTGKFESKFEDGFISAVDAPGLGVRPDLAVLGDPIATYS